MVVRVLAAHCARLLDDYRGLFDLRVYPSMVCDNSLLCGEEGALVVGFLPHRRVESHRLAERGRFCRDLAFGRAGRLALARLARAVDLPPSLARHSPLRPHIRRLHSLCRLLALLGRLYYRWSGGLLPLLAPPLKDRLLRHLNRLPHILYKRH